MFSTGIRRKNRSSRQHRAVSRQQLAMTWPRSSSVGIRRTECSFTMSSNLFAQVSCHRNWRWRSHGNLCGNTCRGYQAIIGVHTDREHIHAHIVFNSVNQLTGEKYHSNARSYYQQIRGISDRLCREHGLSVIMTGEPSKAVSYIEWLRQSKGQPTFRSMLEADLRTATQDANDLGHFFLLMEHMGYEIRHGDRLGFRLRGQERFMYPGRRDPLFTEDGIRAAIQGNLAEIEAGHRPAVIQRPKYRPYRKHPKYTGFLALYVHYLYLLDKIGQRQYPPRMTPPSSPRGHALRTVSGTVCLPAGK